MTRADGDGALAGCNVLVTRPAQQAGELCRLIAQAGGAAHALPAIEIAPPRDPASLDTALAQLARCDLAVFISSNAVHRAWEAVERRGGWPAGIRLAVVGAGSAAALAEHGRQADIRPRHEFSSEGLLACAELQQVAGWKIIVFRGAGGRELLADTLRERGAEVIYAEVYQRIVPPAGYAELNRIAAGPAIDAVVVTSNEGLHNLCVLAGEGRRDWLLDRQVVVISGRTARLADELGFRRPARVALAASDMELFEELRRWWSGRDGAGRTNAQRGMTEHD